MNEFNPIELNANRERQEAEERMAKLQAARVAADFASVMDTPAGRRVVFGLLRASGVFSRAPLGAPTTWEDGRREGRRDIGLDLLEAINVSCRDSYVIMLKEAETNE